MRYLRATVRNVKISVEIEKFPRPGLEHLVPEADVVFYSKTWAEVCLRERLMIELGNDRLPITLSPGKRIQ